MIILIFISMASIIFICVIYGIASHGIHLPLTNRSKYIIVKQLLASGSYTYLPMKKGVFFYDIFGGDIYREHFDTYDEAKEYLKLQEKINKMQGKEIMNVKFEE